jgi:hypothetical protein
VGEDNIFNALALAEEIVLRRCHVVVRRSITEGSRLYFRGITKEKKKKKNGH